MTKMLREHYNIIANAMNKVKPYNSEVFTSMNAAYHQWQRDVNQLADALIQTNPRFNRERFIEACNQGK